MMKIIAVCLTGILACINVYSQDSWNISGEYKFSQAVITAKDFHSNALVFTNVFTDSVQIMTQEWDFPLQPVFSTAVISNGEIVECTLFNDGETYVISGERFLMEKKETTETVESENNEYSNDYVLYPYSIVEQGNTIKITFDETVYGSSNYPNQTLKGVYEMILVKR